MSKGVGLVLEGGGMRGVFTCGVLDCFMDRGLTFPYGVGVSAGACNGLSFVSRQRGRAKFSNVDLLERHRYIGVKYFLRQRSIMDLKLLYHDFPMNIVPYDFDTYMNNPMCFEMVTTNCITGEPCYIHEKRSHTHLLDAVRASSSLPYVCPIAWIDGVPMLDGGIVDSVPLERAMQMGYAHNIVVLTRNRGYRKPLNGLKVPPFVYRRYPKLRAALSGRSECYNRQLEMVERMEDEGKVVVIRPQKPIEVDRMERDVRKLETLYEEGYRCAAEILDSEVFKTRDFIAKSWSAMTGKNA